MDPREAVYKIKSAIDTLAACLQTLDPEEVAEVLGYLKSRFCLDCGGAPGCRCWDDS